MEKNPRDFVSLEWVLNRRNGPTHGTERKRKERRTHRCHHRSKMNVIKSPGFRFYRILYQVPGINQSPSHLFANIIPTSSPSMVSRIAPLAPEIAWLT